MDLNKFKTDLTREDEGVWTVLDATSGARIKVARIGNKRYRDLLAKRLKPYRRAIRAGSADETIIEQVTASVIAETILLGWEGIKRDGSELSYSVDAARKILGDPSFRDFRDIVVEMASDLELYREEDLEEAEGNSGTSSNGKSSGEAVEIF